MTARGWATRLYAAALHAFPRRHRTAYSAEMIDTFERQLSAHRQNGRIRALWFIVAASLNVVGAGLGERRRHRRLALAATAGVSSVDFRLAWRMLIRYPGLSLVSVFGLAVGMALAAGAFTIIYGMFNPVVPLPDGERVVSVVSIDAATTNGESRVMHDFAGWRTLTSLEDIGASVTVGRTLIADGGQPETVSVAEISAAAFRVARVTPRLGRTLLADDERHGAPDVVVIGQDVWQRRFSGDPDIVGRQI